MHFFEKCYELHTDFKEKEEEVDSQSQTSDFFSCAKVKILICYYSTYFSLYSIKGQCSV